MQSAGTSFSNAIDILSKNERASTCLYRFLKNTSEARCKRCFSSGAWARSNSHVRALRASSVQPLRLTLRRGIVTPNNRSARDLESTPLDLS